MNYETLTHLSFSQHFYPKQITVYLLWGHSKTLTLSQNFLPLVPEPSLFLIKETDAKIQIIYFSSNYDLLSVTYQKTRV